MPGPAAADTAWVGLDLAPRALIEHVDERTVAALAQQIVAVGDMCAVLYTATPAMHAEHILKLLPDGAGGVEASAARPRGERRGGARGARRRRRRCVGRVV